MVTPLYVLGSDGSAMPSAVRVRTAKDVRQAYADRKHSVWFAPRSASLDVLAKAVHLGKPRHALLVLKKLTPPRRVLLDALFAVVVDPGVTKMLPLEELREVLVADNRQDLFVAARVVPEDNALVLFRGDLRPLIVPLSTFKAVRGGPKPDRNKIDLTDYGQTVCLGDYEIAAGSLLYEFDPDARRRAKRRELRADDSLGACIRRLRLQKGLARSDFAPLKSKTIARIERGENKPHKATLFAIAKTLGVDSDQLGTF